VDHVLRYLLHRWNKASLVAYGGWALLTLVLVGGTLTSLDRAEYTERQAVLARAQAGAAALEQTLLRVLDTVVSLQQLAASRARLAEAGGAPAPGAQVIEQELRAIAAQGRFGILEVSVVSPDGVIQWGTASIAAADHMTAPVSDRDFGAKGDRLLVGRPVPSRRSPSGWIMHISSPVYGPDGKFEGAAVVSLDPVQLSSTIGTQSSDDGEMAIVQRLPDGAVLARSRDAAAAFYEHPMADDPVLLAAGRTDSGQFRDMSGGVDRLVGYRAPGGGVGIVVSKVFETRKALADFFRLRRIVLAVVLALVFGALVATRLVLANFLLRQRLSEQAYRDPLTGLCNRRFFTDVMTKRLLSARHQGLSAMVILIDLDGFKQINDTRGHPIGDALLRAVATRLQACAGPGDTVMRLGGDEFALVRLGRVQRRDATALARFVVADLSEVYEVDGYHLRISASVGVALPPDGGDELNDLLRSADIALYFVKAAGGSAYQVFDPAMEDTVRTRRALEIDLREAQAGGQLEVYYQPLVRLDPRKVSGFEALLRWHHPVLGMVMPSRFIPIAEETGLIASIGEWVLRQACAEAARWPGDVRIAVNLSPVQFDRSNIVDIVAAVLRETRLDPGRLELEITEGVVMRDSGDVLATMRRLQALGVRLALDDFGTGYSSLSYLRSFPFNKVKIDGSFLADLHGDGGVIIRAVLGLCATLGLDTLVEGVETGEQLEWLKREGGTEVQGHLFSMPRPASGIDEIIRRVASRETYKVKELRATSLVPR
jgi:diguanylate cyclase (GGDEF)-like protein